MRGMTLSQWLDLLIEHYDLPEILDHLRVRYSDDRTYHQFVLKLEETMVLALQNEVKR